MQDHPRRLQSASHPARNTNVTAAIGMGETVGRLRARRNSLFTRTVIWVTCLVCIAFLLGSLAQAWSNSQLMAQVQSAQQQLRQVQAHHDQLVQAANNYKDPAVIEREAREQLGYVRPGEHAIVIVSGTEPAGSTTQTHRKVASSQGFWLDWWNALFGN